MTFNEKKIYVAFYKGDKKLLDKIITWTSRGFYAHVELIVGQFSYSSSGRDGGVRKKDINDMHFEDKQLWDIFELKVPNVDEFTRRLELVDKSYYKIPYKKNNGTTFKYDFLSILLYHVLRIPFIPKIQKTKFICSEFVLELIEYCGNKLIEENMESKKMKNFAFNQGWKLSPTNVLEVLISCKLIYQINE
jgi:hypothetical protein